MLKQEDFGGIVVKIGDFGFSTFLKEQEKVKFYCGTPLSMAPEVLNDKFYTHRVDIWSFGVSLYEAIFIVPPFTGNGIDELFKNVNKGLLKIPLYQNNSKALLDLLSKCIRNDPQERITVECALNHPFMNANAP